MRDAYLHYLSCPDYETRTLLRGLIRDLRPVWGSAAIAKYLKAELHEIEILANSKIVKPTNKPTKRDLEDRQFLLPEQEEL